MYDSTVEAVRLSSVNVSRMIRSAGLSQTLLELLRVEMLFDSLISK